MVEPRNMLPPLDYVLAFEAAAKKGSFSRATSVLNISESSISRKVRLLEQHYGVELFTRGHRSVTLTKAGQEYLTEVSKSLDILRDATRLLSAHSGNETIHLSATNSVASLWLMPRLSQFHQQNSSIRIALMASDDDRECLSDTVDLAILRGDGDWPGYDTSLLFGETIFPVCSPDYLDRHPEAQEVEKLAHQELIEVDSSHDEWMNWTTWMRDCDAQLKTPARAAVFNTYPLAIQGAVDGLGIALGWGHLVDMLLDAGKLVRVGGGASVRTDFGYYLLARKGKPGSASRDVVEQWLMDTSAARKRYASAAE